MCAVVGVSRYFECSNGLEFLRGFFRKFVLSGAYGKYFIIGNPILMVNIFIFNEELIGNIRKRF